MEYQTGSRFKKKGFKKKGFKKKGFKKKRFKKGFKKKGCKKKGFNKKFNKKEFKKKRFKEKRFKKKGFKKKLLQPSPDRAVQMLSPMSPSPGRERSVGMVSLCPPHSTGQSGPYVPCVP